MAGKNKKAPQKEVKNYIDLLYMTPLAVTAKDIFLLLDHTPDIKIELWEDMNIIELELSNQNSIDFEPMDITFKDPSDAAFVKNRNIQTIFAVHLCEQDLSNVNLLFESIIEKFSGFLCADTDDFQPVYVGQASRK